MYITEFVNVKYELSINAMGLLVFYIFKLSILKFDLSKALSRYLSLAAVLKSQLTFIILKPDMLNVVDVSSNKF